MSEMFKGTIWIQILILFFISFTVSIILITLKNVSNSITPANLTKQQIVQFCEQLANQAVNKDWSYKKCISNLQTTGKNLKTLEVL